MSNRKTYSIETGVPPKVEVATILPPEARALLMRAAETSKRNRTRALDDAINCVRDNWPEYFRPNT